jgi:hypothetical protein
VNVPEPLPLNGTEFEANAAGNALSTIRTPKTPRIRIFMSSAQAR